VAEGEVTGREVTEDQLTEREVAVHVFVALDGVHVEEAVASVRAVWGRFRELQHADRELYNSLPVGVPDALPGPAARDTVVAGVQSADRLDQAILRQHWPFLNLSVLLGAGQDREWSGLRERAATIVGPLGASHLGAVTLELGKAPAPTPGDADVSEPERGAGADPLRVVRLLGRTGADERLGAWAWSDGGHPEMPHFVRYLMHMTAIRHQYRTYRWLMDARATGTTRPLARMRTPDGLVDRELPSTAEVHYIRDSVDSGWRNARQALETSGLDAGAVAKDDRQFASSFLGGLNDVLAHLRRAGIGDPLPSPHRDPERQVRVLVVADEWFPARGGLSTFNSKLCVALARERTDVRVMVEAATPEERADAAKHKVRLIDVAQPGLTTDAALSVPPEFGDGFVPDVVIGHGRVTGPPAKALVERYFKNARRLHFLHVEPNQAEVNKPHGEGDSGARAEDRTELELRLCRGAQPMPVGPRLEQALFPYLRTPEYEDLADPVRIDPGFDGGRPAIAPRKREIPQILLMGRLADDQLKGLDIASSKADGPGSWHLLVRGVPDGQSAAVLARARKWLTKSTVDVVPYPYSADPRRIQNDIARASLVLMPSRAEAFGLAGAEAIACGVPVLVSGRSGLGILLRDHHGSPAAARAVMDVWGTEGALDDDIEAWSKAIYAVLRDPQAAFRDAAELRDEMAARFTWAEAAGTVLKCVRSDEST
jgi:glycosyltransferase involved in cell wall biosynthesis